MPTISNAAVTDIPTPTNVTDCHYHVINQLTLNALITLTTEITPETKFTLRPMSPHQQSADAGLIFNTTTAASIALITGTTSIYIIT